VNNLDINLELITQKPIIFNGIKIIQPTLNMILDEEMGMDKYNEYLIPFFIDLDFFNIPDEAQEQYNIFDIMTLDENIEFLLNSISIFCNTNVVKFDTEKKRLYIGDKEGYLDCNNFKEFSDIILKINSKERPPKEIPPKNMSEKQKDIWDKLCAGRKRQAEKNRINLADMLGTCELGGDYYIPIEDILNKTLWNISRCYQAILGKSNYKDAFSIYCVTGEKDLIKRHWTDLISIDDKKQNKIEI
jgi:hypothetical protein